ncbi:MULTISPECIES: YheC/YheD family protein [Lysinibacillus]|uniref:YheC/YheD family protein n=1 Tax=Lysinibacillus TaxID=400634 RepID=UPI0009DF1DBE|nr:MULTISPECIES: YheC/YheD family protein [Lysinibacillus]MDC6266276.1 YheC/YheD family protein [Lysinibacillus sphaericus]KAB0442435.1 UDP-N-acetylmuramoyl-tripeptide--D-alanyl-D-alanine ligase [Lysinibacillus fusiformis]MCE4043000.1 YheC/YheD family protein [Lysinibacillus fusiformis]MCK1987629.1 YheC/YheD family protein [Lysinibacillus fusiformis]MCT6927884.1 YheC/YheD family protein [Lysinibacillus fusiformis]
MKGSLAMTIIGMLHHRLDPTTVLKSYAYAAVAKAEGAQFFYFTPKSVDFAKRSIRAKVYEDGQWQEKTMPFPDVIYNAGSPEKLSVSKEIIERLKEEIPFTTYSIGNKWNVMKRLKEAKEFEQYLIPSEIVKDADVFHKFINYYKRVVFKPIDGRKGKGIYFITKAGPKNFEVKKDSTNTIYSKPQLDALLKEQLASGTFIMQPYIQSITKAGQVYDFRLHVQKNGEGKWVVTTVYPRIAPNGSIIPNINNGGFTNYLDPFLEQEFKEEAYNIRRMLEHFSLALAHHLDDIQMEKFGEVIDEIGIDVGLDQQQKIWMYEVNWRPGCPPAFYLELDVVINSIRYAMYLAKNPKRVKKKIVQQKSNPVEVKKEIVQQKSNPVEVKKNLPIIAITGSAGKTTTKAFVGSILSKQWNVFESKDYWNTTEHTKKHKEEINDSHQAVVLEYGMAYPGIITNHCSIIQPNISIVTNIGLAHVGNFDGDVRGVAKAKSELIHGMDQQGLLILNKDDDNSRFLETQQFKGKMLTVGIKRDADYRAYDLQYKDIGMSFKMKLHGQEIELYIPILGEHHVYNALNAVAVADYLGFSPLDIQAGLNFKKPPRRLTIYNLRDDITVIDDTVHSHPQGVRAAIDVLTNIAKKRKVAIIGQMRELGVLREEEYRKVGEYIYEEGIDEFITYGFRTDEMSNAAIEMGMDPSRVHHFINKDALHALLDKLIKPHDTILVKGASKTNMFETVKYLDQTLKEE